MLFPNVPADHPLWKSVYRQVGKKCNFLVIYGGEADKFYQSLQQEIGHLVDVAATFPLERVRAILDDLTGRVYAVHFGWRRRMVAEAGRKGYLELPTGTSRTFTGGPSVVAATYANECSNFPVQTLAAELVISAQQAIQQALLQRRLKSRIRLNTYDSVTIDCPPTEADEVKSIIHRPLTNPPLMAIISEALGRSVPLAYDLEVKA
jgi:DNA polymerase I-like protein with 3'-5' exonuclease and polymerase domains